MLGPGEKGGIDELLCKFLRFIAIDIYKRAIFRSRYVFSM